LTFSRHRQEFGWRSYYNTKLFRPSKILLIVRYDHGPALDRRF
jgi:hypothetical protein